MIDAQAWIKEHRDEEVAASLNPIFGDMDESIIAEEIALVREKYQAGCMVSEAGQKAVVDMCIKAGIITEDIPYGDVVDISFVENYVK